MLVKRFNNKKLMFCILFSFSFCFIHCGANKELTRLNISNISTVSNFIKNHPANSLSASNALKIVSDAYRQTENNLPLNYGYLIKTIIYIFITIKNGLMLVINDISITYF